MKRRWSLYVGLALADVAIMCPVFVVAGLSFGGFMGGTTNCGAIRGVMIAAALALLVRARSSKSGVPAAGLASPPPSDARDGERIGGRTELREEDARGCGSRTLGTARGEADWGLGESFK